MRTLTQEMEEHGGGSQFSPKQIPKEDWLRQYKYIPANPYLPASGRQVAHFNEFFTICIYLPNTDYGSTCAKHCVSCRGCNRANQTGSHPLRSYGLKGLEYWMRKEGWNWKDEGMIISQRQIFPAPNAFLISLVHAISHVPPKSLTRTGTPVYMLASRTYFPTSQVLTVARLSWLHLHISDC